MTLFAFLLVVVLFFLGCSPRQRTRRAAHGWRTLCHRRGLHHHGSRCVAKDCAAGTDRRPFATRGRGCDWLLRRRFARDRRCMGCRFAPATDFGGRVGIGRNRGRIAAAEREQCDDHREHADAGGDVYGFIGNLGAGRLLLILQRRAAIALDRARHRGSCGLETSRSRPDEDQSG